MATRDLKYDGIKIKDQSPHFGLATEPASEQLALIDANRK